MISNMPNIRSKNHYVPKSYLKRWGDDDDKIWVYRLLVKNENIPIWKLTTASAIGYHKHLYTQYIAGRLSDEIECLFDKDYESPANKIIEKVVLDKRLTTDDWSVLIRFLAAQDIRTPSRLIQILALQKKAMPSIIQEVLEGLNSYLSIEDMTELKQPITASSENHFPVKVSSHFENNSETGILKVESYVGRSTWLHSIKHALEHTSQALHKHKWTIVKPAKGFYWFTSDNPVIKLNYSSQNNYDLKGGWGKEKGNIFLPLGPEHAMFVQIGDRTFIRGTRLSIDQTRFFQKIIAENAHRILFSNNEDKSIPKLRKRIVCADAVATENNQWQKWHTFNSEMEKEYSTFKTQ